tara:strand:+ start:274 stop:504 length:231 start_codon:yes stop_codon:yes gene_type:complete
MVRRITMGDLERMKAEFAAKGGKVTVLPATEFEEIVEDTLRLISWGEGATTRVEQKIKDSLRDQVIMETGGKRDDE